MTTILTLCAIFLLLNIFATAILFALADVNRKDSDEFAVEIRKELQALNEGQRFHSVRIGELTATVNDANSKAKTAHQRIDKMDVSSIATECDPSIGAMQFRAHANSSFVAYHAQRLGIRTKELYGIVDEIAGKWEEENRVYPDFPSFALAVIEAAKAHISKKSAINK